MTAKDLVEMGYGNAEILLDGSPINKHHNQLYG